MQRVQGIGFAFLVLLCGYMVAAALHARSDLRMAFVAPGEWIEDAKVFLTAHLGAGEPIARSAPPPEAVAEAGEEEIVESKLTEAEEAALPPVIEMPTAAEIARVEQRLRANLSRELWENFDLFLYVSKANAGPWAQRMFAFNKEKDQKLSLILFFPVSTGRERVERSHQGMMISTTTPPGYYQFDPNRQFVRYHSRQWDSAMPYAMFFNWVSNGRQTGMAVHGIWGSHIRDLGTRASAGCVRVLPDNAKVLYELLQKDYRGSVPRFAFDERTQSSSRDGALARDAEGNLEFADGYRALVLIEDYGGRDRDVVAQLF